MKNYHSPHCKWNCATLFLLFCLIWDSMAGSSMTELVGWLGWLAGWLYTLQWPFIETNIVFSFGIPQTFRKIDKKCYLIWSKRARKDKTLQHQHRFCFARVQTIQWKRERETKWKSKHHYVSWCAGLQVLTLSTLTSDSFMKLQSKRTS